MPVHGFGVQILLPLFSAPLSFDLQTVQAIVPVW